MTKFQISLLAVFIIFIVVGVGVFALRKSDKASSQLPTIEIWGTIPNSTFSQFISEVSRTVQQEISVNYVEKSIADFNRDFVETLARGGGPDAVLIPQEILLKNMDKVVFIPYETLSRRTFMDTYVSQAELYLSDSGVLALPFTIDPLVMYWNRDSFTNAGIPTYPRFWDEFGLLQSKLTQKDDNSNIRRSLIALGEFQNLSNAREIFGTLMLQAGNPITKKDSRSGLTTSAIGDDGAGAALRFFTSFSDTTNENYSWNRSLPTSKNFFLSGNLATYFGFASEIGDIRQKNPNLDFDVAPIPQIRKGNGRSTYGTMYGFSIVRSSKMPSTTFSILSILSSGSSIKAISELSYLPPVRRDIIASGSTDPYQSIFYDTALISKSWLDPDSASTKAIFREMVESVTSGRATELNAIDEADNRMNILIDNL